MYIGLAIENFDDLAFGLLVTPSAPVNCNVSPLQLRQFSTEGYSIRKCFREVVSHLKRTPALAGSISLTSHQSPFDSQSPTSPHPPSFPLTQNCLHISIFLTQKARQTSLKLNRIRGRDLVHLKPTATVICGIDEPHP